MNLSQEEEFGTDVPAFTLWFSTLAVEENQGQVEHLSKGVYTNNGRSLQAHQTFMILPVSIKKRSKMK